MRNWRFHLKMEENKMFEQLDLLTLQQYWWIIVSLLGALLVFLMFVQGGQTLFGALGRTEVEKTMLVNALGRKWEFTFTTLVTFGGAFFASFPLFYSTSFGGAYWVWMLILIAFVVQAVSYEFRTKPGNWLGRKTYEGLLFFNGLVGTILIGTAVGTFFTGANFSLDIMNHMTWDHPLHGLEAAANWRNLCLGFTVFFLARVLGLMYFINTIDSEAIRMRAKQQMILNAVPFVLCFLAFCAAIMVHTGYTVVSDGTVIPEPYKYWHNLWDMPVVLVLFLAGVMLVLMGIGLTIWLGSRKGIWYTGIGTVITVWMLFMLAGLNDSTFYPSLTSPQSSLTIQNASSSKFTLVTMSYVSLAIPFVLAYIVYAWRSINKVPINEAEMLDETNHTY